ncbi:MAG: hypothetical protein ACI8ZM_002490 [Crocinitomix sp.]|jgi:hypothetical protein
MSQESKEITEFKPSIMEAMRSIVLWTYGYTQDDFKKAFAKSHLGWDYHWNQLRLKFEAGTEKSSAIIQVVLDMCHKDLKLLSNYLISQDKDTILEYREMQELVLDAEKEIKRVNSETTIFQAIQLEYKIFHVFGSSENFDVAAKSDLAVKQKYPEMMVTPIIKTPKEDWDKVIEIVA